ncbi:MAG: hypothetical protein ACPKPY_05930 [Nitrososphaeraceae archaeon]
MLKINALKINITTNLGLYGTPLLKFENGLNIIKGFNSTGKSTIFQSVLYCLGLEELIGGKNDKTMQSVLKSEILNSSNEVEAHVIESNVLLEIEGNSAVTIKRYIASETKNSGLVEVFHGKLLTEEKQYDYSPMFVHDKGAAEDENTFGFHSFLEQLIGWKLPVVQYKDSRYRKLYLQNIFPSFVIEQKAGWTDFLATIPYYALSDKETRAIEYVLNLDSREIQERKAKIRFDKQELTNEWKQLFLKFKSLSNQIACEIRGVDDNPTVIDNSGNIYLVFPREEETILLENYISELQEEFSKLEQISIPTIGEISAESEERINILNNTLSSISVQVSKLTNNKNIAISKLASFKEKLRELENDKKQNEYHLKVKNKGAETGFEIAHDNCPFCSQGLNDSLLPKDIEIVPMQIEENIEYLKAQINLIKVYIENHSNDASEFDNKVEILNKKSADIRSEIRTLKTQLTSDDRLPSIELIEKRLKVKNRLELYMKKFDEVVLFQEEFFNLSKEWVQILSAEKGLPDVFSPLDFKKLAILENQFKKNLKSFNYRSKPINSIKISKDTLLPVVDKYSLKFDSSASDFIRTIWSYTLALRDVSSMFKANHPDLLILDEPGNQEAGNNDLRLFLEKLGEYNGVQSIVFSSFHQSDSTFDECTKNVNYSLIDIGTDKFIKMIE